MPTVIRLTIFAASRARQGAAVCSRADPPDTGPRGGPGGTGWAAPADAWMASASGMADIMLTLASGEPVPAVSTGQMREVDQSMAGYFGIDLARMMEDAGRNLADLAQRLFAPRTVIVLAGPGGNGGGGLAGARHLHNRGITGSVVLAGGPLAPVTAQQASILTRMGILIREDPAPRGPGHRRAARLRAARGPAWTGRRADRLGRRSTRAGAVPRRAERPGPGHRAAGEAVRPRRCDDDARAAQARARRVAGDRAAVPGGHLRAAAAVRADGPGGPGLVPRRAGRGAARGCRPATGKLYRGVSFADIRPPLWCREALRRGNWPSARGEPRWRVQRGTAWCWPRPAARCGWKATCTSRPKMSGTSTWPGRGRGRCARGRAWPAITRCTPAGR